MKSQGKKEIGKERPGPRKLRPSDVLAIPLGEETWGYVRTLRDATFSVLDVISEGKRFELKEVKGKKTKGYASYCQPWDNPTWTYLGKWPFENEEEHWPPPNYIVDILNPKIKKIYHKGQMKRAIDDSGLVGLEQNEGLLFPGRLVMKIRTMHGLKAERAKIEEFAPFTSN